MYKDYSRQGNLDDQQRGKPHAKENAMLSLGTSTGPRTITVRIDDLPETERELVRETLRLITRMKDDEDLPYLQGGIAMTCGAVAMISILFSSAPTPSFWLFMMICVFGAVVGYAMGHLITRTFINRRHDINALFLSNLSRLARCGQLIHEYAEANPWFAKAIKRRFEQVATAH